MAKTCGRDANTEVSFLNGHPYSLAAVRKGVDALDKLVFLGESNEASAVMVTIVAVENCKAGQLDLVYQIYSTRISPVLTTTLDSRSHEKEAPQEQAGVTQPPALRFQPLAGYNRSDDLFGGARIEAHAPPSTHGAPRAGAGGRHARRCARGCPRHGSRAPLSDPPSSS